MLISSCRVALQLEAEKLQFDASSLKVEIMTEFKSKKYFFDYLSRTQLKLENVREIMDFQKFLKDGYCLTNLGQNCALLLANNQDFKKDLASIWDGLNEKDYEFKMCRFAFTDQKVLRWLTYSNVDLSTFNVDKWMLKSSIEDIKKGFESDCTLPNATVDLRKSGFAGSESYQLQKSFESFANNIQLLATPGSEGNLDIDSYPINLFCSELFGGNCNTLCSINVDADAIPEKQLIPVFEILSNIRKIRNRIYPVESSKEDFITKIELELQQEQATVRNLKTKAESLEMQLEETKGVLRTTDEALIETTEKLGSLSLTFEERITLLDDEKSELRAKLESSIKLQDAHMQICLHNMQEANNLKISELEMALENQLKDKELALQLLKLNLSKSATEITETKEESRILRTQNALLKFELEDLKSNFAKFDQLHQQDVFSIVHHAEQVAKLKLEKVDLEALNEKNANFITDIESQLLKAKEESSVLMRQVLELQSKAMASSSLIESARQEGNLEIRCSDLLRENSLLAQNLQAQHNKVEELQKIVENGECDRETIIKLQVQLNLQQKLYSESQERVNSLSREILDLKLDNSKFETQLLSHQAHSQELKERLDQNINLLETLANSAKANSENEEYQKRLEEERKSQQELVDKMLAREAQWKEQRQDLLQNAEVSAESISKKRQVSDAEDMGNELQPKNKTKGKKTKIIKLAAIPVEDGTRENFEKSRQVIEPSDEKTATINISKKSKQDAVDPGNFVKDSVPTKATKSLKAKKQPPLSSDGEKESLPMSSVTKKVKTVKESAKSAGTEDSQVKAASGKKKVKATVEPENLNDEECDSTNVSNKPAKVAIKVGVPESSDDEIPSKSAIKKTKSKSGKEINTNLQLSGEGEGKKISLKKSNLKTVSAESKEPLNAAQSKTMGSLFSRATQDGNTGLLSSFWKRSKSSNITAGSKDATSADAKENSDVVEFPKIPKAYAEKRNLEILYGKNNSIE